MREDDEVNSFDVRPAVRGDLDAVVETLALAFADDPVWGHWSFPGVADRVARLREYWVPFVEAALKFDGIELAVVAGADADAPAVGAAGAAADAPAVGAVAVWVPPGVPELDADDEAAVEAMVPRVCPERAAQMFACFEEFERHHPPEPHWYLSLLATHPAHRGRGLGMALVAHRLARIDAQHLPAHLESTNPGNVARYQRAGFSRSGGFAVPDGPHVDQMWREAR